MIWEIDLPSPFGKVWAARLARSPKPAFRLACVEAQIHPVQRLRLPVALLRSSRSPTVLPEAAVCREIDRKADDANSLDHSERRVRESEKLADILEQDRIEAALVWRGQSDGLTVEHGADCAPQAILECRLTAAPAVNGRGTSWMHAIDIVGLRR